MIFGACKVTILTGTVTVSLGSFHDQLDRYQGQGAVSRPVRSATLRRMRLPSTASPAPRWKGSCKVSRSRTPQSRCASAGSSGGRSAGHAGGSTTGSRAGRCGGAVTPIDRLSDAYQALARSRLRGAVRASRRSSATALAATGERTAHAFARQRRSDGDDPHGGRNSARGSQRLRARLESVAFRSARACVARNQSARSRHGSIFQ